MKGFDLNASGAYRSAERALFASAPARTPSPAYGDG
jgi:hypothetical protein